MLPKLFSIPKIFCTDQSILLPSHLYHYDHHSVKCLLFNLHVFLKVKIRTPIIIEPCPMNFQYIAGDKFCKVSSKLQSWAYNSIFWPNLIWAFYTKWCKVPSRYNMIVNFHISSPYKKGSLLHNTGINIWLLITVTKWT